MLFCEVYEIQLMDACLPSYPFADVLQRCPPSIPVACKVAHDDDEDENDDYDDNFNMRICEMRIAKCEMRYAKCDMRYAICEMRYAKCDMRNATSLCQYRMGVTYHAVSKKIIIYFVLSFCMLRQITCRTRAVSCRRLP